MNTGSGRLICGEGSSFTPRSGVTDAAVKYEEARDRGSGKDGMENSCDGVDCAG